MERPLLIRCNYCGPFPLEAERPVVDQIHEHATTPAHQDLVDLDFELNLRLCRGES